MFYLKVTLPDQQGYKKLSAEVSVDAVQVKIKLKSNNKFPKTVPCDFKTDLLLNAYVSTAAHIIIANLS